MKRIFTLLLVLICSAGYGKPETGGTIPLTFIENKGQLTDQYGQQRADIDFKLEGNGVQIFISNGMLHYQFSRLLSPNESNSTITHMPAKAPNDVWNESSPDTIITYRMDVTLYGANKDAELIKKHKSNYHENYYLPHCKNGITANSYYSITYKNIYNNIDWKIYSKDGAIKYDFIVHPGGNPDDIQIVYNGADNISVNNGILTATTPFGSVAEHAPYSYIADTKETVASSYLLDGNTLSFAIASWSGTLVIDPKLEWCTYYGGSGHEVIRNGNQYGRALGISVNTDNTDKIFMSASTSSPNNIATTGAHQDTLSLGRDGMLVCFDGTGKRAWSTYYGGNGNDEIASALIDDSNHIYIAGRTNSTGLGSTGVFQQDLDTAFGKLSGYYLSDGLLVKFDNTGKRIWSTYYGGRWSEGFNHMTLYDDKITLMYTNENDTANAPYISYRESVQQFSTDGIPLWQLDLPIGGRDICKLTTSSSGSIYLCGNTSQFVDSGKLISTPGCYKRYPSTTSSFLMKLSIDGQVSWCTYLDGTNPVGGTQFSDYPNAIACDADGAVFVAGYTASRDSIATPGTFQDTISPHYNNSYQNDGYIMKFDSSGQKIWGTYYGGQHNDHFSDMTIDNRGDLCLTGATNSFARMATPGGWQQSSVNHIDAFLVKFDPHGQLLWGTYYAGYDYDEFSSIAHDSKDNLYIAGNTQGSTNLSTPGAHQSTFAGASDLLLLKASPDSAIYMDPDTVLCINATDRKFTLHFYTTRSLNTGNSYTAELSDMNGSFANPISIGTTNGTASGTINCTLPGSFVPGNGYRIRIVTTAPNYTSQDNGYDMELLFLPEKLTITKDTTICAGKVLHLNIRNALNDQEYKWTGPDNEVYNTGDTMLNNISIADSGYYIAAAAPYQCAVSDTMHVSVNPSPIAPTISHNAPLCEGDTLLINIETDTAGNVTHSYTPSSVGNGSNTLPQAALSDSGLYIVNSAINNCIASDTADIKVIQYPDVKAYSNSPVTSGSNLLLSAEGDTTNVRYSWTGPRGFSSTVRNPAINGSSPLNTGIYTVTADRNGCVASAITTVWVDGVNKSMINVYPNPNNGTFTIEGILKDEQVLPIGVYNAHEQLVYSRVLTMNSVLIKETITLPEVAAGVYRLRLLLKDGTQDILLLIGD